MTKITTLYRKWLLFIFFLTAFASARAQIRLSAIGGIHSANVIEKNNLPGWDTSYGNFYKSITGFQIGIMGEIPIGSGGFFIQPGMEYILKGRQFSKSNDSIVAQATDTIFIQSKLSLSYIELPVYLTYKIPLSSNHKNSFFISAGPYFSFFFNGNQDLQTRISSTNKYIDQNIDLATGNAVGAYKSFDFGVNAKVGFEFGNFMISGYYSRGLSNFYTAPYPSTFNHELMGASLGIWLSKPMPVQDLKEKDSDFDGVPDKEDACPSVAGSIRWKGCPIPDSDHDGINDEEDSCKTISGPLKYHGCPIPDTDADGVNDEEDSCKTVSGSSHYHGCPIPDRDKDGVNDEEDQCPDQIGSRDNGGCPVIKKEIIDKVRYYAKNVMFESSSSKLTTSSYSALNELAEILIKNPGLRLTIEGHTDNTGEETYNLRLSEKRALAVKKYLVGKGVNQERIKSIGYGAGKPLGDNQTQDGKSRNRRVEFKLEE